MRLGMAAWVVAAAAAVTAAAGTNGAVVSSTRPASLLLEVGEGSSDSLPQDPVSLNIHVKLALDAERSAIDVNDWFTKYCSGNNISLATVEQPHVTMYLTEFDQPDAVVSELSRILATLKQQDCEPIRLANVSISGCYALWEVEKNSCLQHISDAIVNATYQFATKNQTIPDWVQKLPEPLRSEKIEMIQKYGSPNVFSQFNPHVTVGFDCEPASSVPSVPTCFQQALEDAMRKQVIPKVESDVEVLGAGLVGPHGTVLRGKDLKDYNLNKEVYSDSH